MLLYYSILVPKIIQVYLQQHEILALNTFGICILSPFSHLCKCDNHDHIFKNEIHSLFETVSSDLFSPLFFFLLFYVAFVCVIYKSIISLEAWREWLEGWMRLSVPLSLWHWSVLQCVSGTAVCVPYTGRTHMFSVCRRTLVLFYSSTLVFKTLYILKIYD